MLATRADGRVWSLDGAVPHVLSAAAARELVLVPAERIRTLSVALPLPSRARRIAALPFAIEDRIIDRIDGVHLALGAGLPDGGYAVGVVSPVQIALWVAAAEDAGLADAAIMPDALALPVPPAGHWHVKREPDGRILVRTPDGTGFAAREGLFLPLWIAAGKPECIELTDFPPVIPIVLDLRQGVFARPRQSLSVIGRRVALVAAAGLLAHGAIAAVDTLALQSIAAKRGTEMTALLATAAPGRYTGSDPHGAAAVAADLLPAGGARGQGTVLPLVGRTARALAAFGATIVVRGISFDADGQSLRLDLDLADPGAAPSIGRALREAGLSGRFEGNSLIIASGGPA